VKVIDVLQNYDAIELELLFLI